MADLFLLSRVQMRRIERYFPRSHGIARVDDRRFVSAIVFVIENGLRWRGSRFRGGTIRSRWTVRRAHCSYRQELDRERG